MRGRALVLGAGGHAGIAWERGVLAGLADGDAPAHDADRVIGTSAGSIVGALISSSVPLDDLFQRQVDPARQTGEAAPAIDFVEWQSGLGARGSLPAARNREGTKMTKTHEDLFLLAFPAAHTPDSGTASAGALAVGDHCVNAIIAPSACTATTSRTQPVHPAARQTTDGSAPPTLPPA